MLSKGWINGEQKRRWAIRRSDAHTHAPRCTYDRECGRYIPIPRLFFSGRRESKRPLLRFYIPFGSLSLQGRVRKKIWSESPDLCFAGLVHAFSSITFVLHSRVGSTKDERFCLQISPRDRNRRSLLCQLYSYTARIAPLTVVFFSLYRLQSSLIRPLVANVFVQWTKSIAVIIFDSFVAENASSCPISSPLSFKWGDVYAKPRPCHHDLCLT